MDPMAIDALREWLKCDLMDSRDRATAPLRTSSKAYDRAVDRSEPSSTGVKPCPASVLICSASLVTTAGASCVSAPAYNSSIEASLPRRSMARAPSSGVSTTTFTSAHLLERSRLQRLVLERGGKLSDLLKMYPARVGEEQSGPRGNRSCELLSGQQNLAPLGPDLHLLHEHRGIHAFQDSWLAREGW